MGSSYVIKTPKGVAKVKGTVYDINAEGELVVVTGKVKYTDKANGKEVLIASGEKYSGGRELKASDDEKADAAAAAPPVAPVFPGFSIKVPLRQGVWETQRIAPTNFISPKPRFFQGRRIVPRVGAQFNSERFAVPNPSKTLRPGIEYKPSELGVTIGGVTISDEDAIIVIEESIDFGEQLVVKSKTGNPFIPGEVISGTSIPMKITVPSSSGSNIDLDIDVLTKELEGPKVYINTDETEAVKSIKIESDLFTKAEADAYLEEYKNQLGDKDNFGFGGLTSDDLVIDAKIVETGDALRPFKVVSEITPSSTDTIEAEAEEITLTFEAPDIEAPGALPPPPIVFEPPVIVPPDPELTPVEGS